MGWGNQILWPYNSPSKSCCPDPRTGRKVLMSLGYLTGLLSIVICWRLGLFRLLMTRFWRFGILSVSPLNSGGSELPTLDGKDSSSLYGRKKPDGYLNWGYKYPFEQACHFTFASKSFCTHTLNLVKCPVELSPSFSIKSLPEKLFLISVSFLFSLTNTSSFLSPRLSCPFLSFIFL